MKYVLQANITKAETSIGYKLIGLYDYGYVGSDSDNDIIASAKQIGGQVDIALSDEEIAVIGTVAVNVGDNV